METVYAAPRLSLLAAVMWCATAWAQPDPEYLFQAGLYAEEIKGDLHEALQLYEKIIQDFPGQRGAAAKALLQSGRCHEKLGDEFRARAAYQKLLENYPDQHGLIKRARERLAGLKKPVDKIDPLARYYFDRFGVDLTTSTSFDGKYLAYTDWTSGSLMIKRLRNSPDAGSNLPPPIRIVAADLSRSPEFAYYPVWSRDGKWIAYSRYRKPYFVELCVISVSDGKNRTVYSDSKLMIFPHDWTPDAKNILCRTINYEWEAPHRLALISVDSSKRQDLATLNDSPVSIKLSPEGKFAVYESQVPDGRGITVMDLAGRRETPLDFKAPKVFSFGAPVWSPDGKLVLCRSLGQHDLWAMPMQEGEPAGKSYLVQTDLPKTLLVMKATSDHNSTGGTLPRNKNLVARASAKNTYSFTEDFSSPALDPAWSVFEWKGTNVYDYATFGRYSLSERPGHLRYYLDAIMSPGYQKNYAPVFSGWYWLYPSLEISRPLYGDHWALETKVTYSLVDGANGRMIGLMVFLKPSRDEGAALSIQRSKDFPQLNQLRVGLRSRGVTVDEGNYRSPKDTLGVTPFTYTFRIFRADTLIRVEISDDGANFRQVLAGTLPTDWRGQTQILALTGGSWFVPAGSYADWDYIRFRNF